MEEQIFLRNTLSPEKTETKEREREGEASVARYRGGVGKTAEVRDTYEKKDADAIQGREGWWGWLRIIGTESAYRTRCARAAAPTRVTARGKVCCNVTFLAAVPFLV